MDARHEAMESAVLVYCANHHFINSKGAGKIDLGILCKYHFEGIQAYCKFSSHEYAKFSEDQK
jgi:hypothetical protein